MATTQNYNYPSSSDVTVTGIGTPNNEPIPGSSVLIAGENPAGLQTVIQTNTDGDLIVVPGAGSLTDVNLTEVGSAPIALGQTTSSASLPVVIASDDTVAVSAASLPLPTGASTSALQTTGNTTLTGIEANQTNGTQVTSVSNFPATQPISGTVTANQGTANATPWNDNIAEFGGTTVSLGSKVSASSIPVVIASDQVFPLPTGASTSALQSSVQGSSTGGTAATASELSGGTYNSTPLSLTTGQQSAVQLDSHGRSLSVAATPVPLTIYNTQLTVGLTPVRLTVSGSAPASTRVTLVVTPNVTIPPSTVFFIGNSSVSYAQGPNLGVEIIAGQAFIANNDAGDYYIVCNTSAQVVAIMEQY